jgi:hypothetical protein
LAKRSQISPIGYFAYVPERDYSSLLRGQQIEREIATLRVPAPVHSRWKLEYNGMSGTDSEAFEISTLKINGTPLRGSRIWCSRKGN